MGLNPVAQTEAPSGIWVLETPVHHLPASPKHQGSPIILFYVWKPQLPYGNSNKLGYLLVGNWLELVVGWMTVQGGIWPDLWNLWELDTYLRGRPWNIGDFIFSWAPLRQSDDSFHQSQLCCKISLFSQWYIF